MMSIDVPKEMEINCFIRIIIIITFMIIGRNRVILVTFFDHRFVFFFFTHGKITITTTIIYSENTLSRVFLH